MNFNNSLELTQSQKLIITMQLKQSLNILNMSKLELEEEIKREYEENPLLEVEKSNEVDWEKYIKNIENDELIPLNGDSLNNSSQDGFQEYVFHTNFTMGKVIKMNYIIIMIMI